MHADVFANCHEVSLHVTHVHQTLISPAELMGGSMK